MGGDQWRSPVGVLSLMFHSVCMSLCLMSPISCRRRWLWWQLPPIHLNTFVNMSFLSPHFPGLFSFFTPSIYNGKGNCFSCQMSCWRLEHWFIWADVSANKSPQYSLLAYFMKRMKCELYIHLYSLRYILMSLSSLRPLPRHSRLCPRF